MSAPSRPITPMSDRTPTAARAVGVPCAGSDGAGPVVVAATNVGRDALPVLVAERVALRLGAPTQAIAVIEPKPSYGRVDADAAERDLERAAAMYDAVRAEVMREAGVAWPTQVAMGSVARTTLSIAAEHRAQLVVHGIGAREAPEPRDAADVETTLQLLCGPVPVLAAGSEADGHFRRAVVGVDFGAASVRAARLASRMLAPGGMLSLVHVEPRLDPSEPAWDAWSARAAPLAASLLQRLAATLQHAASAEDRPGGRGRGATIGSVTLVGDPATELLEYATCMGADLIAVGVSGVADADAACPGSVVGAIVRRASAWLPAASVVACRAPAAFDRP